MNDTKSLCRSLHRYREKTDSKFVLMSSLEIMILAYNEILLSLFMSS
jgi:hypothetical protein